MYIEAIDMRGGDRELDTEAPTTTLVVGAGVSAGRSAPTWSDLLANVLDDGGQARTDVHASDFLTVLSLLQEMDVVSEDGPVLGEDLDALSELRRFKEAVAVAMRYFVAHARASGRTWIEIGTALGTSAQNAQSNYRLVVTTNYDRVIEEVLREYSEPVAGNAAVALPEDLRDVIDAHRDERREAPWTVILSGGVGTGKTSAAQLVAEELGWPVELVTPAAFLSHGREGIPVQIATVFSRLEQLERSIILLDEMDHFIGDRATASVEESLVMVALLAGLQRLRQVERSLVFLTTQLRETEIDPAMLRRGRVDKLIEMG